MFAYFFIFNLHLPSMRTANLFANEGHLRNSGSMFALSSALVYQVALMTALACIILGSPDGTPCIVNMLGQDWSIFYATLSPCIMSVSLLADAPIFDWEKEVLILLK